jgi:hypothetical protein
MKIIEIDLGILFILFIILAFIQDLSGTTDYGIYLLIPIIAIIQNYTPK